MTDEANAGRPVPIGEELEAKAARCERLAEVSRSPACFEYRAKAQAYRDALDLLALASQAAQPAEADGVEPGLYSRFHKMLLELLAVIHRDGGHKTQEIGLQLSYEQALELSSQRLAATPKAPATDAGEVSALLEELATYLPSIRVFLTSKERPHEAGVKWHDEIVAKINAAREARHV